MALGLPVVVTRVGSISEALEDSWSGLLFEPGDIQALAEHLGALTDDRELARQIGRAGHARLAQGFSLERSVELLLEIYRCIAGTPPGGKSTGGV